MITSEQKQKRENTNKHPVWIFIEAKLIGKDGEIKGLQSAIYQFYERVTELEKKLQTAEEEAETSRAERNNFMLDNKALRLALDNRDAELAEAREKLFEAEKRSAAAGEQLTKDGQLINGIILAMGRLSAKSNRADLLAFVDTVKDLLNDPNQLQSAKKKATKK